MEAECALVYCGDALSGNVRIMRSCVEGRSASSVRLAMLQEVACGDAALCHQLNNFVK